MGLMTWTQGDGKPRDTIPDGVAHESLSYDYHKVILPFCRLRDISDIRTSVPKAIDKLQDRIVRQVPPIIERKIAFGSGVDEVLDDLPGKKADTVRLDSFMNWYNEDGTSDYAKEWEQMYRRNPRNTPLKVLENRHDWLLTLNPLSAGMQKMRLQLQTPKCCQEDVFPLSNRWSFSECLEYTESLERFKEDPDLLPERDDPIIASGL
ncbi:hypothetical protein IFR05_012389 [Cadophora sp. M221]|nr:hypothetical protein IFR05_012389 [Cadophora sp. M221]